jgi:hypothetical protein
MTGREADDMTVPARARPAPAPTADEGEPVRFQELYRELQSADPAVRARAVSVVAALAPPTAVRPLVRAYLHYGDPGLLAALALYGDKLTLVAGRQVRDTSLAGTERARLMDVLGASGDPGALPILRAAVGDFEPAVDVAARAALVRLGELEGVELLDQTLHGTDVTRRLYALRAARTLDHPALGPVIDRHVDRYLAAGGAVPRNVAVALPLLLDPVGDLPDLVAAHVARSPRTLTIVVGPEAANMAEHHRDVFARALPDHRLFFTTRRHDPAEQFEVLAAARDAAAEAGRARLRVAAEPESAEASAANAEAAEAGANAGSEPGTAGPAASPAAIPHVQIALIGDLPSPRGLYPPPHFLVGAAGPTYTARIMFVGEQDFNVVMEWWYYVEDESEVPTDFEVVLTALTLAGDRMTEEEWLTCQLTDEDRQEAFARALLAHRATVGDALSGRSWLF